MLTKPDKNGTSYQQLKHDQQSIGVVLGCIALWFVTLIVFVTEWGDTGGWIVGVATAVGALYWLRSYLKRTKLPKSSC